MLEAEDIRRWSRPLSRAGDSAEGEKEDTPPEKQSECADTHKTSHDRQ